MPMKGRGVTWGGAMGGIENCRIQTLEMCRYEIRGNGGSCSPNPHWQGNLPDNRAPNGGLLSLISGNDSFNSLGNYRYSAGCGSRAFSTPLTRIAIAIAAARKPI